MALFRWHIMNVIMKDAKLLTLFSTLSAKRSLLGKTGCCPSTPPLASRHAECQPSRNIVSAREGPERAIKASDTAFKETSGHSSDNLYPKALGQRLLTCFFRSWCFHAYMTVYLSTAKPSYALPKPAKNAGRGTLVVTLEAIPFVQLLLDRVSVCFEGNPWCTLKLLSFLIRHPRPLRKPD